MNHAAILQVIDLESQYLLKTPFNQGVLSLILSPAGHSQ